MSYWRLCTTAKVYKGDRICDPASLCGGLPYTKYPVDCPARNLADLRKLVQQLTQRGVRVEFLKESLTISGEDTPISQFLLSESGAFAEFERALIRKR